MKPPRRDAAGFTIMELSVVMGILGIFMAFLMQIVFTTTEIFSEGQAEQEESAHSVAVLRPLEAAVRTMVGPTFASKALASDARLLVTWAPIGFSEKGALGEQQVLRSTVRVTREMERQLQRAKFRAVAESEVGDDPEAVMQAVRSLMGGVAFKGRGEMLLLAWPSGDAEGAFLDLRRGLFLPNAKLPFREAEGASLLTLEELDRGFPAKEVLARTEVLATGLLHLSYRMASQYTLNWDQGPDADGPEHVWDSARAGWLAEADLDTHKFTLDLGPVSAKDSTDDVFPRYVEVTVVSGNSGELLPEAELNESIDAGTSNIQLINTDRLPGNIHGNYLKIGSEWIRFSSLSGRTLRGCKRGQRGTTAKSHERKTGVRAGRTEILMIKVLHARDSWNG